MSYAADSDGSDESEMPAAVYGGPGSESGESDSGMSESGQPGLESEEDDYSSEDGANGLLDIEAFESDDESGSDGGDGSSADPEEEFLDGTRAADFWLDYEFPQFSLLPPELRARVWHFFAEATVTSRPRVLEFELDWGFGTGGSRYDVLPGSLLAKRMEPVSAMLMVDHESRAAALRALPDTLPVHLGSGGLVRFDRRRDVVVLSVQTVYEALETEISPDPDHVSPHVIPGFSEKVEHLALEVELNDQGGILDVEGRLDIGSSPILPFLLSFPNLKTVYRLVKSNTCTLRQIHWCGSEYAVNVDHVMHEEDVGAGLTHELPVSHVWPDLVRHREFATTTIFPEPRNLGEMAEEFAEDNGIPEDVLERLGSIEYWHMVSFWDRKAHQRLDRLKRTNWEDLPETDDSDMEYETNSDGVGAVWEDDIDADSFIDDGDGYDDNQVDNHTVDEDSDLDVDEGDSDDACSDGEGAPVLNGFSPIQLDSDDDESGDDVPGGVNEGLGTSDDDDDDEGGIDLRPVKRSKARHVISDDDEDEHAVRPTKRSRPQVISDDEEDEDEQDIRPAKRARPQVISDDEDDEDELEVRPAKRARPQVVSDEDDEDEDEENEDGLPSKRQRNMQVVTDDSATEDQVVSDSSEDNSSGSDDEEAAGSRSLSLAEKLGLHRLENPVGLSDEEDEDGGTSGSEGQGNGYGYGYGKNQSEDGSIEDPGSEDGSIDDSGREGGGGGSGSDSHGGW